MSYERARNWVARDAPVTKILIAANVATTLLAYAFPRLLSPAYELVSFGTASFGQKPWMLVTYPVLGSPDLIQTLFSCFMFWWFGGSLERSWGPRIFTPFFFGLSAVFGLSVWIGSLATGLPWATVGLWLPTFGTVFAWAMLNPGASVNLWGVLPLRAAWVAALDALLLWYLMGDSRLGLFAQGGNLAAWAFVALRPWNRYRGWRAPPRRPRRPSRPDENEPSRRWNPLVRLEERERQRRVDALFRNSGYDEPRDPPTVH